MTMMINGGSNGPAAEGASYDTDDVAAKAVEAQKKRLETATSTARDANAKAGVSTNFVDNLFNKFEAAMVASSDGTKNQTFTEHLNDQIDALGTGDSSDPQKLARYQKAIMMFTVHTNAQTSMVKSISDLDKGIVRDFN